MKNKVRDKSKKVMKGTDFSLPAAQLPDHLPTNLPVLHIWGTNDLSATPSGLSKMRELTPRLEVIELQNVGHWIMVQAKGEVTRAVLDWLTKLDAVVASKL
jgi:soluble epoxide hydrolase/lipid-phosphate phosphatase